MKHSFSRSFISSAPTLPFLESRSVSAVKPEMSTKASDPSICLWRAVGVSRSQSIAIRGTYGVRRSEVETPACAVTGGAVVTDRLECTSDRPVRSWREGRHSRGRLGHALHPLTTITNKHLLPIYDRPMVTYAIEAIVEAGIDELMLVTGGTHAGEFFRLLGNGHQYGIDKLFYGYQEQPGGIAEASARRALRRRRPLRRDARRQRVREDHPSGGRDLSRPALRRAPHPGPRATPTTSATSASPSSTPTAASSASSRSRRSRRRSTPSQGCTSTTAPWEVLPTLEPSGRGELEITDVNNWYVDQQAIEYDVLEGFWGDAGESIDAYYAERLRARQRGKQGVIEGLERIPLRVHEDERGWVVEIRRESLLAKMTRQTNVSFSRQGVIRGLHYHERGQDDLFVCLQGTARVVVLDRGTGETFTEDIGGENPVALYIPGHHAHGFEALTDVLFCYHVTEEYDPADPDERGIPWDDPRVADLWSTRSPILSARDLPSAR